MRNLPRPFRGNIAADPLTEVSRQPAFEEHAEIAPPEPKAMREFANALRGRARCAEDKDHPNDKMITLSVRWARVMARSLDAGADALDVEHG